MTTDSDKKKTSKEKRDESRKRYNDKKPFMVNYCVKKHYWKKWFDEDYIKELYDKHGDETFEILKKKKKEYKEIIKIQHMKEADKLLLKALKTISVN